MFQERGKSEVARVLCRAIASVRGRSLDAREMKLSTCSCIPNGFLTQLARQCWGGAEVATMLQARWCEVFALFGLRPFQWLGFVAWCVCSIPSVSATLFLPLMLEQIILFKTKTDLWDVNVVLPGFWHRHAEGTGGPILRKGTLERHQEKRHRPAWKVQRYR